MQESFSTLSGMPPSLLPLVATSSADMRALYGGESRQIEMMRCGKRVDVEDLSPPFSFCVEKEATDREYEVMVMEEEKGSTNVIVDLSPAKCGCSDWMRGSSVSKKRILTAEGAPPTVDSNEEDRPKLFGEGDEEWGPHDDPEQEEDGGAEIIWMKARFDAMAAEEEAPSPPSRGLAHSTTISPLHDRTNTTKSIADVGISADDQSTFRFAVQQVAPHSRRSLTASDIMLNPHSLTNIFSFTSVDSSQDEVAVERRGCSSFDFSTEKWSSRGCRVICRSKSHIVCECTHMSLFASRLESSSSLFGNAGGGETDGKALTVSNLIDKPSFFLILILHPLLLIPLLFLAWKDKQDWVKPSRRTTVYFDEMALHNAKHSSGRKIGQGGGGKKDKNSPTRPPQNKRKSLIPFLADQSGKTSRASSVVSDMDRAGQRDEAPLGGGGSGGNDDGGGEVFEMDRLDGAGETKKAQFEFSSAMIHAAAVAMEGGGGDDEDDDDDDEASEEETFGLTGQELGEMGDAAIVETSSPQITLPTIPIPSPETSSSSSQQPPPSPPPPSAPPPSIDVYPKHEDKARATDSGSPGTTYPETAFDLYERPSLTYPERKIPRLLHYNPCMTRVQRWCVLSLTCVGIPFWASLFLSESATEEGGIPLLSLGVLISATVGLLLSLPCSCGVRWLMNKRLPHEAISTNKAVTKKKSREWSIRDAIAGVIIAFVHIAALYFNLHYTAVYSSWVTTRWALSVIIGLAIRLVLVPSVLGTIHLIIRAVCQDSGPVKKAVVAFAPFIPSWGMDVLV